MIGLPARSWVRFGVWSAVGIAFYFAYSYRKSALRNSTTGTA
jgi:hypothetical protein